MNDYRSQERKTIENLVLEEINDLGPSAVDIEEARTHIAYAVGEAVWRMHLVEDELVANRMTIVSEAVSTIVGMYVSTEGMRCATTTLVTQRIQYLGNRRDGVVRINRRSEYERDEAWLEKMGISYAREHLETSL